MRACGGCRWSATPAGQDDGGTRAAQRPCAPFVELDAIFHQPNWLDLPDDRFRERVAAVVAADTWLVDGNYRVVQDLVWARADTVIFLDPPHWRVMWQLTRRTIPRAVLRRELWNGNREEWRNLVRLDPSRNILLWGATHRTSFRARHADLDLEYEHLELLRLTSRAAVTDLLRSV